MNLNNLNLGSADKKPETPPSGPANQDESQQVEDTVVARWTSHPIARFQVANFQFEGGLLVLHSEEEAAEFQAVYDQLPLVEQSRIKKIDLSAAEALAREHLKNSGGATKSIDSSTGERQLSNQVGKGVLGE